MTRTTEEKNLRKYLKFLTTSVDEVLVELDKIMENHDPSYSRGRAIAKLSNHLQSACDQAKHFGLGEKL